MIKKLLGCFIIIISLLLLQENSYSINRWFKVSPGFRIAGMAVDIDSRLASSSTRTRFDFGGGFNLDIRLEKHIGLDIDVLYQRKGCDIGGGGSTVTLHYISVPMLAKFWVDRKKMAIVVGPIHNFLVAASGSLNDANGNSISLSSSNTNFYDLGIAFGISYVIADFGGGIRLVGDFRFEFGVLSVYKGYRPELFNRTTPYLALGLNF